ncbi:hypothetical protein HU200_027934 [Digitaria exilis]|uniref:F-box domain-containing protein n=1 Tax=Digitaria exilis TaxID=1010633 RepID=A0A835BWL1_9POAL|nr:hypothetical protein HU200_027934 [Digitaria exilis]
MGELVEEILLRFSPGDPASLVRAALVCRLWRRIVSGRHFLDFHRRAPPPVLALLCNSRREHLYEDEGDVLRRAFRHTNRRAIDARHGRVLLRGMVWEGDDILDGEFAVWDPVTGEERTLPPLPRNPFPDSWNAAVLCAAHPSGACDHVDCHRGPFLVVAVDTEAGDKFVHVYSSEARSWSESILKYNVGTGEMCVVDLPPALYKPDVLITMEGGRLGFAVVHMSVLHLWSRKNGPEADVRWTKSRLIQLDKLLPVDALRTSPTVVGFADGAGIVFLGTKFGVFSINLKSQQKARKVYEGNHCNVLPYMSFCTPGTILIGFDLLFAITTI